MKLLLHVTMFIGILAATGLAELRVVLVHVQMPVHEKSKAPANGPQPAPPAPLVSIYSDEAADRLQQGSLADAVKKLSAAKGWGSKVELTIYAERDVRFASLTTLLGAISENPWLEVQSLTRERPARVAELFKLPPVLRLELRLPTSPFPASRAITCHAVVHTENEQPLKFQVGSFPQVFGLYLLGPRGPVAPDPAKVRPENWMHGERSATTEITMKQGSPYDAEFNLLDYFRAQDLPPGNYQLNVKFQETSLGMTEPLDAPAQTFRIGE